MDDNTAVILRAGDKETIQRMCQMFNQMSNSGVVPGDCKDEAVICTTKKRNLADCDNRRGVTLLFVPDKVFCHMVLNRMTVPGS